MKEQRPQKAALGSITKQLIEACSQGRISSALCFGVPQTTPELRDSPGGPHRTGGDRRMALLYRCPRSESRPSQGGDTGWGRTASEKTGLQFQVLSCAVTLSVTNQLVTTQGRCCHQGSSAPRVPLQAPRAGIGTLCRACAVNPGSQRQAGAGHKPQGLCGQPRRRAPLLAFGESRVCFVAVALGFLSVQGALCRAGSQVSATGPPRSLWKEKSPAMLTLWGTGFHPGLWLCS